MEEKKYFISVEGQLCETNEAVYRTYYKMDRRERYLKERSESKELSLESLILADYPVEEHLEKPETGIEDLVITEILIEELLKAVSQLNDEEKWLINELFFNAKSERELERESGVSRTTLQSRKKQILNKLKKHMKL